MHLCLTYTCWEVVLVFACPCTQGLQDKMGVRSWRGRSALPKGQQGGKGTQRRSMGYRLRGRWPGLRLLGNPHLSHHSQWERGWFWRRTKDFFWTRGHQPSLLRLKIFHMNPFCAKNKMGRGWIHYLTTHIVFPYTDAIFNFTGSISNEFSMCCLRSHSRILITISVWSCIHSRIISTLLCLRQIYIH